MKPFTVRFGVPQHPIASVTVMATDSTSALLFVLARVPEASYIVARPA